MGCLYQLIFKNEKSYIGITNKTAKQRFSEHCRNSLNSIPQFTREYGFAHLRRVPWQTLLYKAIKEYGKENVIVKTLVIADDMEFLKELEIKAIKQYRTLRSHGEHHTGYNMTKGNCPKEIDYVVRTKKWRVTLTPRYDWPPNYFVNKAIYIADFNSLDEARKVCIEILSEESRMWRETVYAEWQRNPNCYDGYYSRERYVVSPRRMGGAQRNPSASR